VKRRQFITLLAGTAAWPLAVHAQQPERMRRVGLLVALPENDPQSQLRVKAFRRGLRDVDLVEGRNIRIDYRFSTNDQSRITASVAELVSLAPDVIVVGSTPVLTALHQATSTIPIVFVIITDPVGQGFVSSLAHPGGHITGFSFTEFSIVGKLISMLKDVSPGLSRVEILFNPDTAPYFDMFLRAFERQSVALEVKAAPVRDVAEIEQVIANLGKQPGSGLVVAPDLFVVIHRNAILTSAKVHRVPAISPFRNFVVEGGLISYGPDSIDIWRRASVYVDRILRGESLQIYQFNRRSSLN
jgi:putative ABC transport system substrate-binding protein